MQWILITPEGLLSSADRAAIISRELYNITRPVYLQEPYEANAKLFEILYKPKDPTQAALIVDTQQVIDVHPNCSLEKLTAVFPELTQEERYGLASLIHQIGQFQFASILPATVTVRDEKYMIANGWIIPDEE